MTFDFLWLAVHSGLVGRCDDHAISSKSTRQHFSESRITPQSNFKAWPIQQILCFEPTGSALDTPFQGANFFFDRPKNQYHDKMEDGGLRMKDGGATYVDEDISIWMSEIWELFTMRLHWEFREARDDVEKAT